MTSDAANSFRDPAGYLFSRENRLFRAVRPAALPDLAAFLESRTARRCLAEKSLAGTTPIGQEDGDTVFEHERIPFVSYAYEWPPEMLHAAGLLTLRLARETLEEGFGLKDATPYNVLFRGSQPVFVDVLSFERRHPGDAVWLPYAQFVRTFLLPLAVNRALGIPLEQILLSRRDGLEPEEVFRWIGPARRFSPAFLSLVSLPTWLGRSHNPDDTAIYKPKLLSNPEQARFILNRLLGGLERKLNKFQPARGRHSAWSDYALQNSYSSGQLSEKEAFVRQALSELRPASVLDAGCNTGNFSRLAAQAGARVVAVDYDPVVVGELWCRAQAEKLNILPLVINFARPSPATGWRNRECPAFLERARQAFDMVFMLALVHHLLVTERVPLPGIAEFAADLTRESLVIEYVGPADAMFRRITRGRDALHADLTPALFEQAFEPHFEKVRVQPIPDSDRRLYLFRKRAG